jgi:hypothetical protein
VLKCSVSVCCVENYSIANRGRANQTRPGVRLAREILIDTTSVVLVMHNPEASTFTSILSACLGDISPLAYTHEAFQTVIMFILVSHACF